MDDCILLICKLTSALATSTGHGKQAQLGGLLDLPSASSSGSTALKHTPGSGVYIRGCYGIVELCSSGA